MFKRISAFILAIVLVLSILPAVRAEDAVLASGQAGDDITWTLTADGHLSLTGTGPMYDFEYSTSPWDDHSNDLRTVVISEGITTVGSCAFYYDWKLQSVKLPSTLTSIGADAFQHCDDLTTIYLADTITQIGDSAFSGCTELALSDLPEGLVTIGKGAFFNTLLSSAVLPEGVVSIGESAFSSCPLEEAYIPASVTEIGGRAFLDTAPLKFISVDPDNAYYCNDDQGALYSKDMTTLIACPSGYEGSFTVPDSVRTISGYTFDSCGQVTEITMTNSVTEVGVDAFSSCCSLRRIDLPDALPIIPYGTFFCCEALEEITIPKGVTEIGTLAFWKCESLTSIALPDTVTLIEDKAFKNCTGLTTFVVPASVTEIQYEAFGHCTGLTEVTFLGSAPAFTYGYVNPANYGAFKGVTATVYYPGCDPTWTEEVRQDYGGDLTWVPMEGHTWLEATCTEPRRCASCGATEGEALGHAYGEWYITQTPSCITDGMERRDCSRCGVHETRSLSAAGHSYTASVIAPTCTESGYTLYTCACGDSYTEAPTAPLGHDWHGLDCRRCDAKRENPFTDTDPYGFYFDALLWAVEEGITTGATETTFDPLGQCQRGQVVTFLWRAAGEPEPTGTNNPFVDVKLTDFYYKAVLWAVEKGITNGLDATHFGPFAYCNRAQVVTFLWRSVDRPAAVASNPFTDVTAGAFYYDAVLWAVEKGVTNGLSATEFGINAICNRAQIVTFLYRTFAE